MAAEGGGRVLAGRRVLLGVAGGIAAYKVAILTRLLVEAGAEVQVVMTAAATRFVGPDTFAALTRHPVHSGVFERTDEVLHVRLAHEADVVVVAPATANVVAKLALGLADDLVTSTLLEARCPLVVAPAMHTGMFEHAATQEHLRTLVERGADVGARGDLRRGAGRRGTVRSLRPDHPGDGRSDARTDRSGPVRGQSVLRPDGVRRGFGGQSPGCHSHADRRSGVPGRSARDGGHSGR